MHLIVRPMWQIKVEDTYVLVGHLDTSCIVAILTARLMRSLDVMVCMIKDRRRIYVLHDPLEGMNRGGISVGESGRHFESVTGRLTICR